MNPNILQQFYSNEAEREAVHDFLIQTLKEMAVDRLFTKQAIGGIYEGKKAIDRCFDRLEEMFKPIDEPVIESSR